MYLNEYATAEHALAYLANADRIPHRTEGEAVLLSLLPGTVRRVLDLGTGDGRLLSLVKLDRPEAQGIALDFSPTMLDAARQRFAGDPAVEVIRHNLDEPLPDLGTFDVIVSSFAIHHCADDRKRELYAEIYRILEPGGAFYNLEHVASPSAALHDRFLAALGITAAEEDPSNKLVSAEAQLQWLRDIGFSDVDCFWKWLELALIGGVKPLAAGDIADRRASSMRREERPGDAPSQLETPTPKHGGERVMGKSRKPDTARTPPVPSDSHADIDAWIARVMPDLHPIVKGLDELIRETIPGLHYAFKWKKAYYGLPELGWIIEMVAYDVSVNVVFFGGAEFDPPPPLGTTGRSRYIKVKTLEDAQRPEMRKWIEQAGRVPGWK